MILSSPCVGFVYCVRRTAVAQDVLQLYESIKLSAPTISLSAFLNGLSDAAWTSGLQQVGSAVCCTLRASE
jgi:hypothetical protein